MIVSQRCRNRSISARAPRGLKKNDQRGKAEWECFQPEVSAEINLLRHRYETILSLFSTENEVEYALSAEKTSFQHCVEMAFSPVTKPSRLKSFNSLLIYSQFLFLA
jgi:hypothetical protein